METQEKEDRQVAEDLWEKEAMMVYQGVLDLLEHLDFQAEMEFQVEKEAKEMMLLSLQYP